MEGENEPEGFNPQSLFDAAHSEEEYADMLMRSLEQNIEEEDLTTEDIYKPAPAPQPDLNYAGYMTPTMASVLPPYLCGEVERVKNSYRTGSYNSIKKLPTNLEAGQIRQTRKQHITENLLINSNNVFKPSSILKNEPFHKPEYIGTDFDKMKNLHKYVQDEEKIQTDSLSRKPFVIQSRIRAKTEDIFHDPEYRFPGMGPGTGLKRLESMVRDNSEEDKIILEPGYVLESKLNATSGLQVKEWTQKIHTKLVKDWSQYKFRVKFTKSNELVIQFQKPTNATITTATATAAGGEGGAGNKASCAPLNVIFPPPNNTLNKYMHNLATHGLASTFGLKKRGDRWNIIEVEYVNSNGSKDGTIPTYGSAPVTPTPFSPSLRKSRSSTGLVTPSGRTPRNLGGADSGGGSAGGGSGAGSVGFGENKHKSVRWFSRSSSDVDRNGGIQNVGSGSFKNDVQRDSSPFSAPPLIASNSMMSSSGATPRGGIAGMAATPRNVTFASASIATAAATAAEEGTSAQIQQQPQHPSQTSPVVDLSASASPLVGAAAAGGRNPTGAAVKSAASSSKREQLRPPRIATYQDQPVPSPGGGDGGGDGYGDFGEEGDGDGENTVTEKVYYLTYSFYAPWIHTSHMNVRRAMGYHNRLKAKAYGEKYHEKYSISVPRTRPRSGTEDSVESADVHYTNAQQAAALQPLPGNNYPHGMYDSFRSDIAGGNNSSTASTPHLAAGRFMTGITRDQRFNS